VKDYVFFRPMIISEQSVVSSNKFKTLQNHREREGMLRAEGKELFWTGYANEQKKTCPPSTTEQVFRLLSTDVPRIGNRI